MKLGVFTMPMHPPGKSVTQSYDEDLEMLVKADELGFSEAWIGEHFTTAWENIPAPDQFIAYALPLTRRMVFGTGVALLHFHDPVMVAHRIAQLDHLAKGRLYFGIGSGGVPTDSELFGLDPASGQQVLKMREAVEVILKLWTEDKPFSHQGQFFRVKVPQPRPELGLYLHMRPYQRPHPPIAVAGVGPASRTLEVAGERGWIPMSSNLVYHTVLPTHWEAVETGAARTGRKVSRSQWRIAREVFVARTRDEAYQYALNGSIQRAFDRYFRGLLRLQQRGLAGLKSHPEMPDDAVTVPYLADNIWIVGSPGDVADKLRRLYEQTGGFGTLLMVTHDWDDKEKWLRCMDLLADKVMPRLADLT